MKELYRISRTTLIVTLTTLFQVGTGYSETAFDSLLKVKSLRCTFPIGSGWHSKTGSLTPSILKEGITFIYDSIDLREGTARSVGETGASNEIATMTPKGMTFIEETSSGNYVFTTVFAKEQDGLGRFFAATSRHMEMMGTVIVSQYYGTCQVLPSQ